MHRTAGTAKETGADRGTPGVFTFSTRDLPERDRLTMWREVFARAVVKVDLAPQGEQPFHSSARVNLLPGVTVRRSSASPAIVRRTAPLVADGDDNLVLVVIRSGQMQAEQGGREAFLDQGGAYLWSNAATGVSQNPLPMDLLTLTLPRRALAAGVRDLDRALMRPIPPASEALRLLVGYVDLIQADPCLMAPDLAALAASHVQDLAAVALGATREAAEAARVGGIRAARLQAVKADILAHLTRPDLTVDAVALRQGISPRYIRALLDAEQTSFTDFVREQRLRLAFRRLSNPALAGRTISAIAHECGFGDLSYFYAAFRARFGSTPGDVRANAFAARTTPPGV